jgi:hypothetical protein
MMFLYEYKHKVIDLFATIGLYTYLSLEMNLLTIGDESLNSLMPSVNYMYHPAIQWRCSPNRALASSLRFHHLFIIIKTLGGNPLDE